jgi:hypothetical protein
MSSIFRITFDSYTEGRTFTFISEIDAQSEEEAKSKAQEIIAHMAVYEISRLDPLKPAEDPTRWAKRHSYR